MCADAPRALLLDDGRVVRACARQLVADVAPSGPEGGGGGRAARTQAAPLLRGLGASALAASPDGQLLAVAERGGGALLLLCARTLAPRGTLAMPHHVSVRVNALFPVFLPVQRGTHARASRAM